MAWATMFSIYNAMSRVGADPKIVRDPDGLKEADGIVIPGVGAFGSCMDQLSRFEGALLQAFDEGVPMLGICVGMQVLFEESEESPGARAWLDRGKGCAPARRRDDTADGLEQPHHQTPS